MDVHQRCQILKDRVEVGILPCGLVPSKLLGGHVEQPASSHAGSEEVLPQKP